MKTNSEFVEFKVHPRAVELLITRQAGTLAKAILEGEQNAVDAKATRCDVVVSKDCVMISDNGIGFPSRKKIMDNFMTLCQPQTDEEQAMKTYGTFRIGRGQMFAFGRNRWLSGKFQMDVDIKAEGEEWGCHITEHRKALEGCDIEIELYEELLPSQLADTLRDLKLWSRWMPCAIYLNDELISMDPEEFEWTHETEEAWIGLEEWSELHVYNLGSHVLKFPKHKFGTGGEVVSKKGLKVNTARNDIQSDCPVWRRIRPKLDQYAKERVMSKGKSLDDAGRERLARGITEGEGGWHEWKSLKLLTAVSGRHYAIQEITQAYSHNRKVTCCRKGDRVGDRLHKTKVAFVVAVETLTRFGVQTLEELAWLIHNKSPYAQQRGLPVELIDFNELKQTFSTEMMLVNDKEYSPKERIWLDMINSLKWHLHLVDEGWSGGTKGRRSESTWGNKRKIVIGESDVAAGWTDAKTYIAIERGFLKKQDFNIAGMAAVGDLLLHEFCHREPDLQDHDHDQGFYELFHDSAGDFLGVFVDGCFKKLPEVLKKHNKRLTKVQLKQQDKAVMAEREKEMLAARLK